MLPRVAVLAVIVVLAGFGVFWVLTIPATVPMSALSPRTPNLDNGKTMFFAGGCASCHATPNQDDKTKLGGGFTLKTTFGNFYAPNISPDPDHGIGGWSEADFITAMMKGTSPNGEHYYPAFPYTSYQRMRIDDLRDLFAYLKTLPPVQSASREHDLPAHFKIRRMLGVWKFLFLDGRPVHANPNHSVQWNRGSYLVNGPAHCAECHSPRNILGGIIESQRFAGGPDAQGDGFVPNITRTGLGSWTHQQLATLLETGEMPDGDSISGDMAKVVANTSKLSAEDRAAIAVYLKSLPPVEGPKRPEKR
jgi:mono/diheme cytochrome c family protein